MVTNLTGLWMDDEKQDALLLCGLPDCGADYDVFRNLCRAFAAMPGHPIRDRAERQLRALFDCSLPPLPENAETIWRTTANRLLEVEMTPSDAVRATTDNAHFPMSKPLFQVPEPAFSWSDSATLPEPETGEIYTTWVQKQHTRLRNETKTKPGIALRIPKSFAAEKPDLYHVERHLSGEEPNPDLWIAQTFRLLCKWGTEWDQPLILRTGCPPIEVERLFTFIGRQAPLCRIVWLPEDPSAANAFLSLCRAAGRGVLRFACFTNRLPPLADLAKVIPLGQLLTVSEIEKEVPVTPF